MAIRSGGYQSIVELANRAEKCLQLSASLVRSKAILFKDEDGTDFCRWELFLEQPPSRETIETCALSVGVLTLLACGERVDDPIIQGAMNLVEKLQLIDGGWTSFSPSEEESLTVEAFLALRALLRSGREKRSETISRGIDWLRLIENEVSGGWGFYKGDKSYILTTSYAIRVVAEFYREKRQSILARDIINRGMNWILNQQIDNTYYVREKGGGPSAVQTSLALLALVAGGFTRYSSPVVNARNWLLEQVGEREGTVEAYRVPKRAPDGSIQGFHRRIAHVSFPEGTILQALLASGASLLDPRLLGCVENLLDLQEIDGSWKCYGVAYEQPIWAVMDASIVISEFIQLVKSNEQFLEITEGIQGITKRFAQYESQQATLSQKLDSIEETLQQIALTQKQMSSTIQAHDTNLADLSKFSKGLVFLKPIAFVVNLARRFPLLVTLVFVVVLWSLLRIFAQISNMWLDIITGVLAATLLGMELYLYYRRKDT